MCGITGLVALDSRIELDRSLLERMTDSIAHRGPDGRGIWIGEGAGIGHRRLAIIDIEGGAQPWVDDETGSVLTYNGEIYNHAKLRRELESDGVRFRSKCDTEVLAKALVHWGIDTTLKRIRGMYAFGWWEPKSRRLILARDHLGIKPLYWAMRGGLLRFGSEIKTILADPSYPRNIDHAVLVNYIAHYRLAFKGRTLFTGIHEVQAGTYVVWEGKRHESVRYWSLPRVREADKTDLGEERTADEFRRLLTVAVRRRLMSDVPLGAYLSGGIDSAVIVTLMRSMGKKRLSTFSIGFEEEGFNEFDYAKQVSRSLGVTHSIVTLTEEGYFKEFEALVNVKDTPLSVPNEVPLRFLSRHLKKVMTVVLSGEGADELLGGYPALVRSPHDWLLARSLAEGAFTGEEKARVEHSLQRLYGTTSFRNQGEQFLGIYQWIPKAERESLFSPSFPVVEIEREISDEWESVWVDLDDSGIDPYEKVLAILEEIHLSALLLRLDATTMAESVEGRVPFTDRDLVEWSAVQPVKYKVRWLGPEQEKQAKCLTSIEVAGKLDISKYLLRLAFAGTIPDDILMRPKTAFPVPLDSWMFGSRNDWAAQRILTRKMGEIFKLSRLEEMLRSARGKEEGMKHWMLANIGIWLEMYFGGRTS
ncbi:MAG: asparagine synthase (glutamine-hydrolyzing) [bacterium]